MSSRTTISPLIKAQLEKLFAAGNNDNHLGQQSIYASSPVIIPKKPSYSNASSHSISPYISVVDQMSSSGETSLQSHRDIDDALNTSLPFLPNTCQYLEHSAARDRIAVKNKRRQAIKNNLESLKENDNTHIDLFASKNEDEEIINEQKLQQQVIVNISDLDVARTRLRDTIRSRDHSADNVISKKPFHQISTLSVHRSISCKRPPVRNETKPMYQSFHKIEKSDDDDEQEEENKYESKPHSSSQEHIYDNFDFYKPSKPNLSSDENSFVQKRETSIPITNRLRPVTMLVPSNSNKQLNNEFENVFNQMKKCGSIRKIQSKEATPVPSAQEPVQLPSSYTPIEERPTPLPIETEPIVYIVPTPLIKQPSIPKKVVSVVHLPTNNKIVTDDNKPAPSWIDIAKQKQTKFQSTTIEKKDREESEQRSPSVDPVVVPRRQVNNVSMVKENTSENNRINRKSMFESTITRRVTPPISTTTNAMERDSIRALKTNNPNRINNLIQLFDK